MFQFSFLLSYLLPFGTPMNYFKKPKLSCVGYSNRVLKTSLFIHNQKSQALSPVKFSVLYVLCESV